MFLGSKGVTQNLLVPSGTQQLRKRMKFNSSSVTASAADLKVLASLLGYSQYGATPTFVVPGMSYEERNVLLDRVGRSLMQPFLAIHDRVDGKSPSASRQQIGSADEAVTLSFTAGEIDTIREAVAFALTDMSTESFIAAISGDAEVARQWHLLLNSC